jgi:transposase-like protein
VAFEAAYGWGWLVELLEELELEPHLVHPSRCKAIASARLKNDKVDAATLAQLLRADLLPEAWIAPQQVRDLRALLRHRASLVRSSTALKNRVHAVLADRGIGEDRGLWTGPGRAWLADLELPPIPRGIIQDCCGLLDALATPIGRLERQIAALEVPRFPGGFRSWSTGPRARRKPHPMAAPRKYPPELRERAVRLWRSEQPRRPIAHVARELGIHPEVLRSWIRRDQADHGERTDLATTAEREELQRLRKRVVELGRANEILKAASAFFAPGARPDPATVMSFITEHRDRFGSSPSSGCSRSLPRPSTAGWPSSVIPASAGARTPG